METTTEFKNRSTYLLGGILFFFAILLFRVLFLSFFNGNRVELKPENKVQRGNIYDRRGIELALSLDSSTIGINPEEVKEPSFTASKLEPFVGIPAPKIESMIREKVNYFLIKRELDNSEAKKIMNMRLPGIRQEKEFKRVYPNGTLASSLLGFTGMDDDVSLSGIEYVFHKELTTAMDKDTQRGYDLHLTIDSLIQYRLESALGKAFQDSKSKKAIGIFMDIHSGKIMAMASFPTFDPNRYSEYSIDATTNWAIRHIYEPGSTMKTFIAMILINEGIVDKNEKYFCPGHVEFGNRTVRCTGTHGLVDLDEILLHSCNVGIIKAIRKVPHATIYSYLKRFKFGEKVGFNSFENKGYFPDQKKWTPSSAYFMAIGQGISVTPIQLVTSAAAIVNGGKMHTPIVVSHITNSNGNIIKQFDSEPIDIGMKPETSIAVIRALKKVVQQGTGKNAFLQDYSIAGKTGTSQKAKSGQHGYIEGLFTASFLGYFPAENPKVVGLILFDEPVGAHTGGGIAAPVFKEVVESIIPIIEKGNLSTSYQLKNTPQPTENYNLKKMPNLKDKTVREVVSIAERYGVKYKVNGSGFCDKQFPLPDSSIQKDEIWMLYFER